MVKESDGIVCVHSPIRRFQVLSFIGRDVIAAQVAESYVYTVIKVERQEMGQ